MTSRRGFIAQLAALVAAGTAAPAIVAQLRPSAREPFRVDRSSIATLTTADGAEYSAPIVNGVADFTSVLPGSGWIVLTDVSGAPAQIRIDTAPGAS